MMKLSRPVVYSLLLALVAYAAVVLTEPEPAAKKKIVRTTRTARAETGPYTAADYAAHFERYGGKGRDAFAPAVMPKRAMNAANAAAGASGSGARGGWSLTGISAIDDVPSALLENGAGETVFLKAGDEWHGLRVTAVADTSVSFVNALGQRTKLVFASPDSGVGTTSSASGGIAVPPAPPAPRATAFAQPVTGTLPPLAVLPPQGTQQGQQQGGDARPNGVESMGQP